jgi:hypothetical protein
VEAARVGEGKLLATGLNLVSDNPEAVYLLDQFIRYARSEQFAPKGIEIQKAIDSLPKQGGKVVLLPGTYVLGNCIRPKDNTELEIRGTLKVGNAVTSPLTADVTTGQTVVHVADASKFRVGQWVTLIDDDPRKDFHGGRKYGESVTVKSIEGNTLTVSDPLAVKWANRSPSGEVPLVDR